MIWPHWWEIILFNTGVITYVKLSILRRNDLKFGIVKNGKILLGLCKSIFSGSLLGVGKDRDTLWNMHSIYFLNSARKMDTQIRTYVVQQCFRSGSPSDWRHWKEGSFSNTSLNLWGSGICTLPTGTKFCLCTLIPSHLKRQKPQPSLISGQSFSVIPMHLPKHSSSGKA